MAVIPLGMNSFMRGALVPEVVLKNLYMESTGEGEDKMIYRLQRPGLKLWKDLEFPVSGFFQQDGLFDGHIFVIRDNTFMRINPNNPDDTTEIGDLNENGLSEYASSFEKVMMVTDGGLHQYNGVALSRVDVPDGHIPVSIASINAFFVIACKSGRFYWIKPGESTINPLDYATAEQSPDGITKVQRVKDELRFYGPDSVEVWQMTGDSNNLFQRVIGRDFDTGCAARDAVCLFDNSVLWVGRDNIVYREGSVPERISNSGVEERLRKRIADPSAFTYKLDGHYFYVLRIPGQATMVYDAMTQMWSEFQTYQLDYWQPHACIRVGQDILLGSSDDGRIWTLDPNYFVDDVDASEHEPIERVVTGSIIFSNSKPLPNYDISLTASVSAPGVKFGVRWKDGNNIYSTKRYMRATNNQNVMALYQVGECRQPIRTFEFSIDSDCNVAIYEANFGVSYGR